MTSESTTPRPRFKFPPMTLMTAAVALGLAVVATVTVFALHQPWLGVKSIYRKLGISSRAEVSWQATRLGL